ncbi:hypothetical protein M0D69_10635 [Caballeronia sp. SEWSISQ10-4 2]|nr:hypothetical protein [Caballeronia sp. SEWSISQ10-4 2]MDN7178472.1 hypothetical protein [Caballeronia sp. SEWSISQ10-4 2]
MTISIDMLASRDEMIRLCHRIHVNSVPAKYPGDAIVSRNVAPLDIA